MPRKQKACPHVTGIVARCYASGECSSETDTEAERVTAAMRGYLEANPSYGFTGDALSGAGKSQYYGYPVWAAQW